MAYLSGIAEAVSLTVWTMRDPHVISLLYRVETDETISYLSPPSVEFDSDAFTLCLEDSRLTVHMKQHFPTEALAREVVEDYLRAWELDVALRLGPGELRFVFEESVLIDRNPPPPGTPQMIELCGTVAITSIVTGSLHVKRAGYPSPPTRFRTSPDVETMWQRYQGYRSGREPLLAMAYFCLTLVEAKAGGRTQAAQLFSIEKEILKTLGDITANRGDSATARKFPKQKALQPITSREAAWVEAVVKALIRRLAEFDPADPLPHLKMSDLPPL